MAVPIELIPLNCIRCDVPIPANPDEIAWVCRDCGQGQRLQDEQTILTPLEVHYSAGIQPGATGKPYWVVQGQVSLDRQTFGRKAKDSSALWSRPHKFIVPAYECPLDQMIERGTQLLRRPPSFNPGSPAPFTPVTLLMEDLPALVDFIVVAIEAERKDSLRTVHFNVQISTPELWIFAR